MNNSWSKRFLIRVKEYLIMVLAAIYLITVFAAIIRFYLLNSFLVEVDGKETFAIILF